MTTDPRLRVLVVDDSATARAALIAALSQERTLTVVGEAETGEEALRLVKRLQPSLVTMDVYLGGTTGIDATRAIMAECPTPILVVTACHPTDPSLAFRAVEAGALDICGKLPSPLSSTYAKQVERLNRLVRALAGVPLVRRHAARPAADAASRTVGLRPAARCGLVAIGASTGGPPLVGSILRALPADFSCPVVVVQHIVSAFGAGFADWLAAETARHVVYVRDRVSARAGRVYVAGDRGHLVVDPQGELAISQAPPVHHQRPAIDVFFQSVAQVVGPDAVGILLTGMGSDGAQGLAALRSAGALTIAQSPATCAVASMPEAAIALGAASMVLDPSAIVRELVQVQRSESDEARRSPEHRDGANRHGKGDA